jgi:hypothetical protein
MIYEEAVTSVINFLNPTRVQSSYACSHSDTILTSHGAPTEIVEAETDFTLNSAATLALGIHGASDFTLTSEATVQSGCLAATAFTLTSSATVQMKYVTAYTDNLNLNSRAPGVRKFSYLVPEES